MIGESRWYATEQDGDGLQRVQEFEADRGTAGIGEP